MNYLKKSFSVFYGSKNYRENQPNIFQKEKKMCCGKKGCKKLDDVEFRENGDGTVSFDLEVTDEMASFIEEKAKEWNMSSEDAAGKMIEEGLKLIQEQKKNEKKSKKNKI